MVDWSLAQVLGDRVDPAVLPGSGTSLAPRLLHHPEECVIDLSPNAGDRGRTAYPCTKFARNIGADLHEILHQQHVVPAIGTALPDAAVQIVKKKGSGCCRLEEIYLGHFSISPDWRVIAKLLAISRS
jgi:hypothetical protein